MSNNDVDDSTADFAEDILCRSGDLLEMTEGCEGLLDEVSDAVTEDFCDELGVGSEVELESLASRVFMSLLSCMGPLRGVQGLDSRVKTHFIFEEFRVIYKRELGQKALSLETRLAAFDYLIGEIEASRMLRVAKIKHDREQQQQQQKKATIKIERKTTVTTEKDLYAYELARISYALEIKTHDAIKIIDEAQRIVELCLTKNPNMLGPLLFPRGLATFSKEDMLFIREAAEQMHKEYAARRQLMVKRAEAAIQAALWSQKGKDHREDILKAAKVFCPQVKTDAFSVSDLILAHSELATPQPKKRGKESQANSRLKNFIICDVPDRGGRPLESRMIARESCRTHGKAAAGGGVVTRNYNGKIIYVDINK